MAKRRIPPAPAEAEGRAAGRAAVAGQAGKIVAGVGSSSSRWREAILRAHAAATQKRAHQTRSGTEAQHRRSARRAKWCVTQARRLRKQPQFAEFKLASLCKYIRSLARRKKRKPPSERQIRRYLVDAGVK